MRVVSFRDHPVRAAIVPIAVCARIAVCGAASVCSLAIRAGYLRAADDPTEVRDRPRAESL